LGAAATPKPTVLADTQASEFVFQKLDCSKELVAPAYTTQLTIVDLEPYLVHRPTIDTETFVNTLIYEFTVKRNQALIPFNYIISKDTTKEFYCNKPDFVLNDYLGNPTITVLLVDKTQATLDRLQNIIDKYKIWKVSMAPFILGQDGVRIGSETTCKLDLCTSLSLYFDPIEARHYNFDIKKIDYPNNVVNPTTVTINLELLNNTDFVFPDSKRAELVLKEISNSKIPELYSASWKDFKVVGVLNDKEHGGQILQNTSREFSFNVGPYLKPGEYQSKFAVFINDKKVPGTEFNVKIKFKQGDYELGVINSREFKAVNLRSAPNLRSEVITKLLSGDYVIWKKQEGAWVLVKTIDGKEGWVYRRFIQKYLGN